MGHLCVERFSDTSRKLGKKRIDVVWRYVLIINLAGKYHRNHVQSHYMRCQGVYPSSVPPTVCAETSRNDLLHHSLCSLDQCALLFGHHLCFDLSMYPKGKDMASVYPRSMYEHRCPDRDLGILERHLRHFHLGPSPSLYLASADTNKKEAWCLSRICYRTVVRHLLTRLLRFACLTVRSACISSICRLVYSVKNLLTRDKLYTFQEFGMWR